MGGPSDPDSLLKVYIAEKNLFVRDLFEIPSIFQIGYHIDLSNLQGINKLSHMRRANLFAGFGNTNYP